MILSDEGIFQLPWNIFFLFFHFAFSSKIHSCRLEHPKYVSFNNVMCCNLSRPPSSAFPSALAMEKRGEAEKISFNLWLTARAHPPLLQPFFCYLLRHYAQVDDKNWMVFCSHCFRIILNFAVKCFSSSYRLFSADIFTRSEIFPCT